MAMYSNLSSLFSKAKANYKKKRGDIQFKSVIILWKLAMSSLSSMSSSLEGSLFTLSLPAAMTDQSYKTSLGVASR